MSDIRGPGRMSEEQLAHAANLVFDRSTRLSTAIAELQGPEPGSALYGDDRASDPHKVSHTARQGLMTAADHLDAAKALIVAARIVHMYAPFTLARAAIETASTAAWVLAPSDRRSRVHRALRLAVRDAIDGQTLAAECNLPTNRTIDERRAHIDEIARAAGVDRIPVKASSSTEIVREAEGVSESPIGILPAWRVGSGFAHGRPWATLSVLDREELPGPGPDVLLKVSSALDRVLWVLWAAVDATELGLQMYRAGATRHY